MNDDLTKSFSVLGISVDDNEDISSGRESSVIIKSGNILGVEVNIAETISKASVLSSFSYSGDIKIEKTGKDIKEAMERMETKLSKELIEAKKEAEEKLKVIRDTGIVPDEEVDGYYYEGVMEDDIEKLVDIKMISWRSIDDYDSPSKESTMLAVDIVNDNEEIKDNNNQKTTGQIMREYNKCVREAYGYASDLIRIGAFMRNLEDNKKYPLTMQQVLALGM